MVKMRKYTQRQAVHAPEFANLTNQHPSCIGIKQYSPFNNRSAINNDIQP